MIDLAANAFSWARLFSEPEKVRVVKAEDGRTIATDRYTMWHLDPIAEFNNVEVPQPGLYQVLSKKFRPIHGRKVSGAQMPLTEFFDAKTAKTDPDDHVAFSAWHTNDQWPVIRYRDASVRAISADYLERFPKPVSFAYWVAAPGWEEGENRVIVFDLVGQKPIGTVQLLGSLRSVDGIELPPHLAEAFAIELTVEGLPEARVAARYGDRRRPAAA